MKTSKIFLFLLGFILFIGCRQEPPAAFESPAQESIFVPGNPDAVAAQLVQQATWEIDPEAVNNLPSGIALGKQTAGATILDFRVQPIARGVVHYKMRLRVGAGPYNFIGIHRVVRETAPCRPIRSKDAIFLQHGDGKDFEGVFLPGTRSSNTPYDFGMAVYLAENDVDVWGIDQAWTLVPEGPTDFNFMKDWGLQKNIDDLRLAIAVARSARFLTGGGSDKMILLGYSSGGATGYATLNQEALLPASRRQVKGFVSADMFLKTDDPVLRQVFISDASSIKTQYDAGTYQYDIPFQLISQLARSSPNDPSPVIPGLNNLQAALFYGAGQIFGDGVTFHYLAGVLDNSGIPSDLQLMTIPQWLDFLQTGTRYEAAKFLYEYEQMITDVAIGRFADHLADVRVPVFNVAAKGGLGQKTVYGTTLLGSKDVTTKIVELGNPNILLEYGHIDLFTGRIAQAKVWRPILDWVKAHK